MHSTHAPNRNPCDISFAIVDRRLSSIQRDELYKIDNYYDGVFSEYRIENKIVTMYNSFDSCWVTIDNKGKAIFSN